MGNHFFVCLYVTYISQPDQLINFACMRKITRKISSPTSWKGNQQIDNYREFVPKIELSIVVVIGKKIRLSIRMEKIVQVVSKICLMSVTSNCTDREHSRTAFGLRNNGHATLTDEIVTTPRIAIVRVSSSLQIFHRLFWAHSEFVLHTE